MNKNKDTKHTPGPLSLGGPSRCTFIAGDGEMLISADRSPEERYANRERLVLAWNAHDDLLAACEAACNDLLLAAATYAAREEEGASAELRGHVSVYRAAIARAKGEGQ